jgi:hypothetical protein
LFCTLLTSIFQTTEPGKLLSAADIIEIYISSTLLVKIKMKRKQPTTTIQKDANSKKLSTVKSNPIGSSANDTNGISNSYSDINDINLNTSATVISSQNARNNAKVVPQVDFLESQSLTLQLKELSRKVTIFICRLI